MGAPAIIAGVSLGASIFGGVEQNKQRNKALKQEKEIAAKQAADQAADAARLAQQTLEQPKIIAPDNFMAQKASQLSKLRLGMASTMTGAGLAQPAALTPASALKSKLGA